MSIEREIDPGPLKRAPKKPKPAVPQRRGGGRAAFVRRPRARSSPPVPRRSPGLALSLRDGVWWVMGTYLGERVRQSTGETERVEAEKRLADIILRTRDQAVGAVGRRRKFGEVALAYRDHGERSPATKNLIDRVIEAAGPNLYVDEVNQGVLKRLAGKLLRPNWSEMSFKRTVVVPTRAVCNFGAAEYGHRDGCPQLVFHRIREGKRRTVTVRPDQAEEMIRYASERGMFLLALVIPLACCEGLRRGELHSLDWRFVNLERRTLTVRDVKSRPNDVRDRIISAPRCRTLDALREWRERNGVGSGPVMLRPDKEIFRTEEYFGRLMNEQLREVGRAFGYPDDLHLHVLRHSAASWHYRVTPDLEAVKERMDWASVSITHRYVHLLHGVEPEEVLAFWR